MIRDLAGYQDQGSEPVTADVLVIGAGTAGLVIAARLADEGFRVIVLESGDRQQEKDEHPLNEVVQLRSIYSGASRGRFRCLGGTSTRWGGALIPFVPADMDPALWPVSHDEICAYLPDVEALFGLAPGTYDWTDWAKFGGAQSDHVARLAKWPPFGKRNVANLLSSSIDRPDGAEIWLNATATGFDISDDGRLKEVTAEAPDRSKLRIRAQHVVIAAGAIESTRLLLLADRQNGDKFFAPDGVLGRYFHDHLSVGVGDIEAKDRTALNRVAGFRFEKGGSMRNLRFELSKDARRREHPPACFAHIAFEETSRSGFEALRDVYRQLQKRRNPSFKTLMELARGFPWLTRAVWWRFVEGRLLYPSDASIKLIMVLEQPPRAENRIFLSDDRRDVYGQPLAVIDWAVGAEDQRAMTKVTDMFLKSWAETGLAGLGRINRRPPREAEADVAGGGGIYHPGGTVRMGRTPADGVLDGDLRVFRLPNVHVISTAAFPTGGGANPTMMLMMCAMRCVAQLSKELKPTAMGHSPTATAVSTQ
ncbi:GMC oxidoreductase [Methylocella silvestris]|uniref:Glucose-methanol-choline oxidoreductase C-terminal domain-containing protein n=1 Tax=Methylocella silvestris TaxID=199596 RepID=A0A2J7TKD1_METSI|nr:GMC oxidoreductase [Methylocella silvestris]PNG27226.1 hypothetical protein CR492_03845 [Methylocella silvestris]